MMRIIPIKANITAPEVAMKFKGRGYRNHGLPSNIISDRDSLLMSKFCKALFESLGTKSAPSTAYHPQTYGKSEIANRKVEEMIRAFANYNKKNWDYTLVDFEVTNNSAVNSTTLCSPFEVNYGLHPRTILQLNHFWMQYTIQRNSNTNESSTRTLKWPNMPTSRVYPTP